MSKPITYVRYYFPNGLRWTMSVILLPFALYLLTSTWYLSAFFCLIIVFILWSFKYVTSIDPKNKLIQDKFYRMAIPFGKTFRYLEMQNLLVTREKKSYKAATRSRDYWVNYMEYSLHLKYDNNQQLTLFTINDPNIFKSQVEKFAKKLNLRVESS